jgi:hypothetical protein
MQPFQADAFCLAVSLTDVLDFDGCSALPINGLAIVSCPTRILLSFQLASQLPNSSPNLNFRSDLRLEILGDATCTRYLELVTSKESCPGGFLVSSLRNTTRLVSV